MDKIIPEQTTMALMTLSDAAKMARVSRKTIERAVADRQLKTVRIRRARRITPADWQSYLDRATTDTNDQTIESDPPKGKAA